jgi:hypothetical protein
MAVNFDIKSSLVDTFDFLDEENIKKQFKKFKNKSKMRNEKDKEKYDEINREVQKYISEELKILDEEPLEDEDDEDDEEEPYLDPDDEQGDDDGQSYQ